MTRELAPSERVRDDFDRIARLGADSSDHNSRYHAVLLRALPDRVGAALDIGCGAGDFTRLLAARSDSVLGVDLSPEMLRVARARCAGLPNVRFEERDVLRSELPPASFDVIASIATLHHLPMAETLARLRDALRPDGRLVVLDVVRDATPLDFLHSVVAVPVNMTLRIMEQGSLRVSPEFRAAWAAHGATDHYLSLAEVAAASRTAGLDGARVQRHLLFRYSLLWRKPS